MTATEVIMSSSPSSSAELPALRVDDADDESYSSSGNHSEEGGQNLSDSDPKDSGIDCSTDQNSTDVPDEETAKTILDMVEFYLSDANILKDPFLLKHVRRNKEGYVSVKLLASFRKVRSISRNWKAVAHSVQKSKLLALNADGTKVRRLTPLPDHDETVTSRSVIVHGFGSDGKLSVDGISELFSKCGDIALVRILRPGGSIPGDVKRFLSKNPDVQSKICALVEFEEHASAKKALESEQADGIKVIPVLLREKNNNKPSSPKKEGNPAADDSPVQTNNNKESPKKKKKNRKGSGVSDKTVKNLIADDQKRARRSSSGSMSSQSSGYLSSSPGNTSGGSFFDSRYPRRHSFNPAIYNDPNSSFASLSNRYHNGSRDRLQRTGTEGSGTLSPWRRRREQLMMQSDSSLASASNSNCNSNSPSLLQKSLPVRTIRSPKGPDGTKGFLPRQRTRLPSTAE